MVTNDIKDNAPETLTLKALRVNLGWSQEYASMQIGITKATLASYESGETYPTVPIIKRILKVYNISFDRINFLVDDSGLTNIKEGV